MKTVDIQRSMATQALATAVRDVLAAVDRAAKIAAGLNGAVMHARECGLPVDAINRSLAPLVSHIEVEETPGEDAADSAVRDIVQQFACREIAAQWAG